VEGKKVLLLKQVCRSPVYSRDGLVGVTAQQGAATGLRRPVRFRGGIVDASLALGKLHLETISSITVAPQLKYSQSRSTL
jgi:hypothetical protein